MAMIRPIAAVIALVCGGLASSCQESANPAREDAKPAVATADAIPPKVIEDATASANNDINIVPATVTAALAPSAAAPSVALSGLQVQLPGQTDPLPLDWWLVRQGEVQVVGANYLGQLIASFTPKGLALANAAGPWFAVSPIGRPSNVNCDAGASVSAGACSFDLKLRLTLTQLGRSILGKPQLPDLTVRVSANLGAQGSQLISVTATGPSLQDQASSAIFGAPDQWATSRQATLQSINQRLVAAAAIPPQPANTESEQQ